MTSLSTVEEQLSLHGKIIYTNVGVSMMPLIREGRDVLVIERPSAPLRKNDVPLYVRSDGALVLHRIVRVLPDGYLTLGDNCFNKERIDFAAVVGVLTGLIRDGREMSARALSRPHYLFYVRARYLLRHLRHRIYRSLVRRNTTRK